MMLGCDRGVPGVIDKCRVIPRKRILGSTSDPARLFATCETILQILALARDGCVKGKPQYPTTSHNAFVRSSMTGY
jgi:hypothetical protein